MPSSHRALTRAAHTTRRIVAAGVSVVLAAGLAVIGAAGPAAAVVPAAVEVQNQQLAANAAVLAQRQVAAAVSTSGVSSARAAAAGIIAPLAVRPATAPTLLWTETFGTAPANSALTTLPNYAGGVYTADAYWLNFAACNGVIVNYNTSTFGANQCTSASTNNQTNARVNIRRLADVLGQVGAGVVGATTQANATATNRSTTATQANRALVGWTDSGSGVAGADRVLTRNSLIGWSATSDRYYLPSIDLVEASCSTTSNRAQITLSFAGITGSPISACSDTRSRWYTSPYVDGRTNWMFGGDAVQAGRFTSDTASLLSPQEFASNYPVVRNLNNSSGGNDFAIDNLRVLDATPTLDVDFVSTTAKTGEVTQLRYTVTNTTDNVAKQDWGFTNVLPAGLVLADRQVASTCGDGALDATGPSDTVAFTGGDLAAGAANSTCTITVNVVAADAGTYTVGDDAPGSTVTTSGLKAPTTTTIEIQAKVLLTVRKALGGNRSNTADQFTLSIRQGSAQVGASVTTTGTGSTVNGEITRRALVPGGVYTIHETSTNGTGLNYANRYECTVAGTVIASGDSGSGTFTMPSDPDAEVICVFTNTPQAVRLACDVNHFYSVASGGALVQADIADGSTVSVGGWTLNTGESANGLGIARNGAAAYAFARNNASTGVAAMLRWTQAGGFTRIAASSYAATLPANSTGGALVAGAMDLSGDRYVFGRFRTTTANNVATGWFDVFSYNVTNNTFATAGSFRTSGAPNGNGDLAFDAKGNLYVLGAAASGDTSTAVIFVVKAADFASGGTLPVTATVPQSLDGTDDGEGLTNVNGIAFSPRGTAYLSDNNNVYEFDPTTWTRMPNTARVPAASTDLSSCSSPSTITVQKHIVGRVAAGDQFTLTLRAGDPLENAATVTTTGTTTGRQTAQIGPVPAPVDSTLTFTETASANSAAYRTVYECWADGIRISSGTTTTGTVTMPSTLSVAVTCTFFNTPQAFATITLRKSVVDGLGQNATPTAGWTLGAAVSNRAGSDTATFPIAPTDTATSVTTVSGPTGADGSVTYYLLFGTNTNTNPGSNPSSATVTVSETQQSGYRTDGISCLRNNAAAGTGAAGTTSLAVAAVQAGQTIDCTFTNRPVATLTLVKTVSYGSAAPTSWTLAAGTASGALTVPGGATGATGVTNRTVSAGVAYRLSESGGPVTYVQDGAWSCVDTATSQAVTVSATNDVTLTRGTNVRCTVTNGTASIKLLTFVQSPDNGLAPADWTVTATPNGGPTGLTGASIRGGATVNTFEARPGQAYTLSEALTPPASSNRAFRVVGLQKLTGTTPQGQEQWTTVTNANIAAPAVGATDTYRYVYAAITPIRLPLTGGPSADTYLFVGAAIVLIALSLAYWQRRRARKGTA